MIIFTDSEITHGAFEQDYIIKGDNAVIEGCLTSRLRKINQYRSVKLAKIPAHAKIPGNIEADKLAAKGSESLSLTNVLAPR